MTKQEVFDGLKEVLTVLRPHTDLTDVNFDTELVRGLGIDSLTMMLLSLAVEEKFKNIAAAPLERLRVVFPEQGLDLVVFLELRIQKHPFDSQADAIFMYVLEHQDVRSLTLVLGQDADEERLDGVVVAEGTEDGDETEGEEAAFRLADGAGDGRHRDGEAHELVLLVDDEGDEVLVHDGDVLLHVAVDLLFRELGVFVQRGEGVVQDVEHLPAALGHFPDVLPTPDVQAVALLHEVRVLEHRRQCVGEVDVALGPVHILGEAHPLQELAVVGEVVDDREGGVVLEPFHQEAFPVHVGEAEGSLDFPGAPRAAPGDDRIHERFGHVEILDEVDPAEADGLLLPFLTRLAVADGGHAADGLPVPPGEV